MPENKTTAIAAARYTRSINIVRDFSNQRIGIRDYQATPLVLQTTARIIEGLQHQSTARAFSLIGPYGSGKSAYGVFLAHYLQGDERTRRRLVAELNTDGIPDYAMYDGPMLLPVLISGDNGSLREALLRGLQRTFNAMVPLRDGRLRLPRDVDAAAEDSEITPQQVADLFTEASVLVADRTAFRGLVVVIDELGQFLDYASRQGEKQDLFVLQTMAEMAARSGNTPCLLVTILHQAFDRYATTAGAAQRTEWAKVQGRFADIPFQEPPVQMLRMVARALSVSAPSGAAQFRQEWSYDGLEISERLSLRPTDLDTKEWQLLIERAYPLHPTVLLALPLLFRQLAQNERSLFAFLASSEPFSVQDFLSTAGSLEEKNNTAIYRLPNLFAYIHATMGASLFARARGQRWAELAEALAVLPQQEGVVADVLATIGTLGALGQARGLKANHGQILFALRGAYPEAEIERALNELQERSFITFRQHRDSYVLWEGSDLDLDEMTRVARREISSRLSLVKLLQQHADNTPQVARQHSYRTGAARVFTVDYIDIPQLTELSASSKDSKANTSPQPKSFAPPIDADGEIVYIVAADDEELQTAENWAKQQDRTQEPWRIVVLPQRIHELRDLILDVAALQFVLAERPELENDRVARREVASRLAEAQQALENAINEAYGVHHSRWFWCGEEWETDSARAVDDLLSRACDVTYIDTPHIWNELIIRRQLSASAAKARRNLVEAMITHSRESALGIKGYPAERAVYESIFRISGIHRQDSNGVWYFGPPSSADPAKLILAWNTIQAFIDSTEGEARPIVEVYKKLEAPPFGIKAGLTPLLVVAAYVANAGEVALYEHGNYVPVPDVATFERVLRQPGYFSLRRSRAGGVRVAVYERLAKALAPRALDNDIQPAVLDAITPLLRLVGGLQPYARATHQLSQQTQAIRLALLDARAPDELLFERLPEACGLAPFDPEQSSDNERIEVFFTRLRTGLEELQNAYPQLVERVRERIRKGFSAATNDSDALRAELVERYHQIGAVLGDAQLRALGIRIENGDLGDGWVESVAALVGRKPLESWNDTDVANFDLQIAELGRRFQVTEQIAVTSRTINADVPVLRIGLADGKGERSRVIRLKQRPPQMQNLYDELNAVLARYGTLTAEEKIAILAELLQPNLEQTAEGNGHHG